VISFAIFFCTKKDTEVHRLLGGITMDSWKIRRLCMAYARVRDR